LLQNDIITRFFISSLLKVTDSQKQRSFLALPVHIVFCEVPAGDNSSCLVHMCRYRMPQTPTSKRSMKPTLKKRLKNCRS